MEDEPQEPAPTGGTPHWPGEDPRTDPRVPDVFRDRIPPPPKGWSEEDWRRSLLGDEETPPRGRRLGFGKNWLYVVVLGAVLLALVIAILVTR